MTRVLPLHESLKLLERYGIPVAEYALAKTADEAVEAANRIGYPVVLKLVSPTITHKTDVGGVVVGLKSPDEVKQAYNKIIDNVKKLRPDAVIKGILVQKQVEKGIEVIVGGIRDDVFGAAVMFGLGGVFVEVLRDVSFRIPPFSVNDALEMMQEIKGYKLLKGFRNIPPADLNALANIIVKVGEIMINEKEIKELDINPIIALPRGAVAVDARAVVKD